MLENDEKKKIPKHNCFDHDIDGGVCMICGANTIDLWRSLGFDDDEYFKRSCI